MKLSSVYNGLVRYALVYHTGHTPTEVEFVTEKFFSSKKKALKWYKKRFGAAERMSGKTYFLDMRAVPISGFDNLQFVTDK